MTRVTRRSRVPPARLNAVRAFALAAAAGLACPAATTAQDIGSPAGAAVAIPVGGTAAAPGFASASVQQPPLQPANVRTHAVVFAVATATLATAGALQSRLAPSWCRWCDLHADGTDALNGLDRGARRSFLWDHPDTASTISDVLAFGLVPAVAFGADAWGARAAGRSSDFKVDALVIGEAVVIAANATEIMKFATARQRPYAHARALGEPVNVSPASSDNLSFSSGHVAAAFAITVSAARVMTLRRTGRPALVWSIGLPAAAAVAYLRIAADRHYLTDVLAAAGIGTVTGLIVPRLVFREGPAGSGAGPGVAVAPLVTGPVIGVSFTW